MKSHKKLFIPICIHVSSLILTSRANAEGAVFSPVPPTVKLFTVVGTVLTVVPTGALTATGAAVGVTVAMIDVFDCVESAWVS